MNVRTLLVTLTVCAAFGACTNTFADEAAQAGEDPMAADVLRLIELSRGMELGQGLMDRLISIQQNAHPQVPAQVWDRLRKQFDLSEMKPVVVAIYERHFTREDIRGLIAFYESPLGVKLVAAQPQLLQESMVAGQKWAASVLERMQAQLKEMGYSS